MSNNTDSSNVADNSFDSIVNTASSEEPRTNHNSSSFQMPMWVKHGGFFLVINIWRFFFGPSKIKIPKQKDSRFKFVAEQLISTLPANAKPIITATSEKLLSQHRTIENTEARRRLEKWACRTIIIYHISVFALVILNGISRVLWPQIFKDSGFISDTVMNVILSTTTVNIIGLGVIVLKGHFPKEEKEAQDCVEKYVEDSLADDTADDTADAQSQ